MKVEVPLAGEPLEQAHQCLLQTRGAWKGRRDKQPVGRALVCSWGCQRPVGGARDLGGGRRAAGGRADRV